MRHAHCDVRHPVLCIVPPHILEHLARQADPELRAIARAALQTLLATERLRSRRESLAGIAPPTAPAAAEHRTIYDARHGESLPGRERRAEGEAPVDDVSANEAYDGLGATYELFSDAFQRRSIDGRGGRLDASIHYRRRFNNAFWDGGQMVFGDGDGVIFQRFTRCVDVIGHELAHGVTQCEAALEYHDQPGALNEHFSDVFGSLVKQFRNGDTADTADWLIGAGLFEPGVHGAALRSMKAPGTAYDDPRIGRDPQPAHMRDYDDTFDDSGGVHVNSGIPNHAFQLAATALGGHAWERAGVAWYLALTDRLDATAQFTDAAEATVEAAGELFGAAAADAVRAAWTAVGVPSHASRRTRPRRRMHEHSGGAERRARRTPKAT